MAVGDWCGGPSATHATQRWYKILLTLGYSMPARAKGTLSRYCLICVFMDITKCIDKWHITHCSSCIVKNLLYTIPYIEINSRQLPVLSRIEDFEKIYI